VWFFSAGSLTGFWIVDKLANPTGGTPGATNPSFCALSTSAAINLGVGGILQNAVITSVAMSGESISNGTIASEVSGVFDIFPIAIAGTSVGARGRIGTLQDIWAGSAGVAIGDTYPATGSPAAQFVQISQTGTLSGGLILPWNNGAVNLT
jgi:hypothetical protein